MQPNPWSLGRSYSRSSASAHLAHAPHDAELLRVDEALQHHPDGHIDIVLHHIVPQVHAGVSLGHADHGLDVTHRDGDAAGRLRGEEKEVKDMEQRLLTQDLLQLWGAAPGLCRAPRLRRLCHLLAPSAVVQAPLLHILIQQGARGCSVGSLFPTV